jgi:hypothetical protein
MKRCREFSKTISLMVQIHARFALLDLDAGVDAPSDGDDAAS